MGAIVQLRKETQDAGSEGEDYLGIAAALAAIERWDDAEIYCAKAKGIFGGLAEQQPLAQITHFRTGVEHTRNAIAQIKAGNQSVARQLVQEALTEFKQVGDFLLFKLVERLLAACEE